MSLAELRAQAEAEESQEVVEQQEEMELDVEEPETDEESEAEEAEGEAEELDDFELELEGEPEQKPKKPSAAEALTHKLTKQRKRAQKAESEVETLRAEIDQLKAAISGTKPQQAQPRTDSQSLPPMPPDKWSEQIGGDDNKYRLAMAQYNQELVSWVEAQKAPQVEADNAKANWQKMVKDNADQLSEHAAKFIEQHKVKPERVIEAIELARDEIDEVTGRDDTFVILLNSIGEDSGKVAYHLGRSEQARNELKELLRKDPSGIKAVARLATLATKLKPKVNVSRAPEPDSPVKGDMGSIGKTEWQRRYDKEKDPSKLLSMRRAGKQRGWI